MNAQADHIHLDPIGGIAGDMFAATLLDLFPGFVDPCLAAVRGLIGTDAEISLKNSTFSGFAGAQFGVRPVRSDDHAHRAWRDIRAMLQAGPLDEAASRHAVGIFQRLADAEAKVHGAEPDDVHFHEVGAVDSVADIAAAGFLIAALGPVSWSVGALPLGGGTVKTRHGVMPVPAPATVRLLEGFTLTDDGITGERVTPTGAAILAHLEPAFESTVPNGRLIAAGMGFGTRTLPDRPNVLRTLAFERNNLSAASGTKDQIGVIRFEIDDQTGEDLAVALDRLRSDDNVLDALQIPAFGKKGRMMVSVQILVRPQALDDIAAMVMKETTTLGVRTRLDDRRIVMRREVTDARGVQVKIAERAGHKTAKADMDDIASKGEDHAGRTNLRRAVEADSLAADTGTADD
jgi:uncharacterized protein (TIGR00299 family) protein